MPINHRITAATRALVFSTPASTEIAIAVTAITHRLSDEISDVLQTLFHRSNLVD